MRIADILKIKGSSVHMVRPTDTIETLATRLRDDNVGAMLVSEKGVVADGIISERDVTRGLATHGAKLLTMTVSQLMTSVVISCAPQDGVADVAAVMTRERIRHLPVKDRDHVVGFVSIGDIVKYRLEEMQLETSVLRDYAAAAVLSRGVR